MITNTRMIYDRTLVMPLLSYSTSKRLQNTYTRGWAAAELGQKKNACPYPSNKYSPGWGRSYERAWCTGWNQYHEHAANKRNILIEVKNAGTTM